MQTIFDCETDVGTWPFAGLNDCTILVRTSACLTATKRVMKVEQRCFFRCGDAISAQPWGQPAISIEPAHSSEPELVEMVEQMHAQFLVRIRAKLPEVIRFDGEG